MSGLLRQLVPHVTFIEGDMVFVKECAHLLLEAPLTVMCFLRVDVAEQSPGVCGRDRERAVASLPREGGEFGTLGFQPSRRRSFRIADELGEVSIRMDSDGKMDVVGHAADTQAIPLCLANHRGEVGMEVGPYGFAQERATIFCAENDVHQNERERLRHCGQYRSGLQPSGIPQTWYLGLRPRLVWGAPLALGLDNRSYEVLAMKEVVRESLFAKCFSDCESY